MNREKNKIVWKGNIADHNCRIISIVGTRDYVIEERNGVDYLGVEKWTDFFPDMEETEQYQDILRAIANQVVKSEVEYRHGVNYIIDNVPSMCNLSLQAWTDFVKMVREQK